ncbi:WD repeat-containing protein 3 [Diaphorina citri]|uniref:WD repeat-containing protein 3 n=1 Tax=Diaphorina citri TaxID=121845 RepID=A0A3Q0ISY3_DIACI|nr:WD repeat-containing protein 3 [Diaphorina citri]
MGLTKQYLRYVHEGSFNIIASPNCNVVFVTLKNQEGRFLATGASEDVIIWDLRLAEKALLLPGEKHEVCQLSPNHDSSQLAVAYTNGSLKTFSLDTTDVISTFTGHKSAITVIQYDPLGHRLATGSKDTDIVLWDVVAECGLHRLSGHKGVITDIRFMSQPGHHFVVSSAKDTFVKIWDADTGDCFKTMAAHLTEVWGVCVMREDSYLISGSNDAELKVWNVRDRSDIDTEDKDKLSEQLNQLLLSEDEPDLTSPLHCDKAGSILRSGKGRVHTMVNDKHRQILCCHGNDNVVDLFYFCTKDESSTRCRKRLRKLKKKEKYESPLHCDKAGSILRSGKGRVHTMVNDKHRQILCCHGNDNVVDLFYFCTKDESSTRCRKRLRKLKKKEKKLQEEQMEVVEENPVDPDDTEGGKGKPELVDVVKRLPTIKTASKTGKIKSVDVILGGGGEIRLALLLNNNSLELHSLSLGGSTDSVRHLRSIHAQGHHSEVRALAFSSDNLALVSACASQVKIWNRPSLSCLRTIDTGSYALSVCFVPGDRHVLVGTKDGRLLIVDIGAGEILEDIPAHSQELWSVAMLPDQIQVVTGGGDKSVKLWQLELVSVNREADEETKDVSRSHKVLSLLHTRTLKLEEQVLCARVSPDSKLLAVSLLDTTVKIFFLDTFKFFISLYGHKLPVLSLDMSYDSTLIATGSGDRTVKVWGLDYGDCHKSLLAHEDSVTGVTFVPKTHYFFTTSKDGRVKQWDADNFERIVTLHGHNGEVHALVVSPSGQHVASSGSDRTIRLYSRTEEVLFFISLYGHKLPVLSLDMSYDSTLIATGSGDRTVKVWGLDYGDCHKSLLAHEDSVTGVTFVPKTHYFFTTSKDGRVKQWDADNFERIVTLHIQVVTGGGDKSVKLWQLELVSVNREADEETKDVSRSHKVLSLLHTRTLKLEEQVLCARVSPDSKLLAVSLLDTTVKIFFLDTFKFFISLYGHKLPVLSLDMSYDSTLIATGSGDRTVKVWGLDYGDCHKSLLAHEDSVTGVTFVPKTHYFFTTSKDGRVKQWDADNFERIVTLHGHNGEVHALVVSPSGQHVASSSWGASKQAELLMECLATMKEYEVECKEMTAMGKPPPSLPPIMKALNVTSPRDYLMTVLSRIRSTELEEVLLVLSLSQVTDLLTHLSSLLDSSHHRCELVIRVAVFLVRIHHGPLTASKELLPVLQRLEQLASRRVEEIRDVVGYNLHTMYFLQRELEEKESVQMFLDATLEKRTKDKKKRKRENAKKTAIISL